MKRQTRFCRLFTACLFAASDNVVTNRKLTNYNAFLHPESDVRRSERSAGRSALRRKTARRKAGRSPALFRIRPGGNDVKKPRMS